MENFFTQKLSWNNVNTFPHSTFNWVGLDGTQVICHMTPVDTYTAQATVADVRRGIWNHKVTVITWDRWLSVNRAVSMLELGVVGHWAACLWKW